MLQLAALIEHYTGRTDEMNGTHHGYAAMFQWILWVQAFMLMFFDTQRSFHDLRCQSIMSLGKPSEVIAMTQTPRGASVTSNSESKITATCVNIYKNCKSLSTINFILFCLCISIILLFPCYLWTCCYVAFAHKLLNTAANLVHFSPISRNFICPRGAFARQSKVLWRIRQ